MESESKRKEFSRKFLEGISAPPLWGAHQKSNDLENFTYISDEELNDLKKFLDDNYPYEADAISAVLCYEDEDNHTEDDFEEYQENIAPILKPSRQSLPPANDLPRRALSDELLICFRDIARSEDF